MNGSPYLNPDISWFSDDCFALWFNKNGAVKKKFSLSEGTVLVSQRVFFLVLHSRCLSSAWPRSARARAGEKINSARSHALCSRTAQEKYVPGGHTFLSKKKLDSDLYQTSQFCCVQYDESIRRPYVSCYSIFKNVSLTANCPMQCRFWLILVGITKPLSCMREWLFQWTVGKPALTPFVTREGRPRRMLTLDRLRKHPTWSQFTTQKYNLTWFCPR